MTSRQHSFNSILKRYKPLVLQMIFFGFVGLTALLIDVGVTSAMYYLFHIPAYAASAIGFSSAFFFTFPMNRKKVFKHTPHDRFNLKQQMSMYISLAIFNLLATSFIVELLVTLNVLDIEYAKILTTALIAVWNFLLFKFLIFSKHAATPARKK